MDRNPNTCPFKVSTIREKREECSLKKTAESNPKATDYYAVPIWVGNALQNNECVRIYLDHQKRHEKLVTNSSLIPLKLTRIGPRYFLYRKVTYPQYMHVPCGIHSFSPRFICLLLLFVVYHAEGVAFSSLLFATKLLLNLGFAIHVVLMARLWTLMIRYDT